jgi:CheY-like chemotaxis protein
VSSLGGQLICETAVGHGTTFTITLPIAYIRHTSSELPRSGPTTVSRGRILLVDDEESLLRAMTRLLKPDHEVVAVSDARTALAMLTGEQTEHYDLVFCDLMMPHVSGMELFAHVKAHNPKTAERFVFMTAGAISEDARSFLAASTNPCVEKPFGSAVLRALAQKLVRKFASIRPIEKAE